MIVSASRRTDIPCCHAAWFMERIRAGFCLVRNPRNPRSVSRVPLTPDVVDCIVFWTKDPAPLMPYLDELDARGFSYVFQFTVTPYGREIEPGVRSCEEVAGTFEALSRRIGAHRVLWRYDPVLLTDGWDEPAHAAAFDAMASHLAPFTRLVTISFLDRYPGMRGRALAAPDEEMQMRLARTFAGAAQRFGLEVRACCERLDFSGAGIRPAACIDRAVLEQAVGAPLSLKRDAGQRDGCGCFESVDIGAYGTCRNACTYCYAMRGASAVCDALSPLLGAPLSPADTVRERKAVSNRDGQLSLY